MQQAIISELNKRYTEAAAYYEAEIENDQHDILPICFINLAFLYWCFAFELFEFVIPHNIPDYWSKRGGEKFLTVLDSGLAKFPNNAELHFWKKYLLHISYGDGFTKDDCLSLIETYGCGESSVPYFFLYALNKVKYSTQRELLISEAEVMPTAKNLYIKSVLLSHA
ncbi:hypothetical protein [Mucilaginibacter terrae]|uniref:Uncharacterized protein n=1 Tax=Mucilaginibacter terrae TaxID=1955052 RepID=A0ABU3GU14_9SPHI|nr:hypothetical protein [Mucilaginibacter terrae]MDT3402457.1 hypothetical protein [Mucilaginibacter terrae]